MSQYWVTRPKTYLRFKRSVARLHVVDSLVVVMINCPSSGSSAARFVRIEACVYSPHPHLSATEISVRLCEVQQYSNRIWHLGPVLLLWNHRDYSTCNGVDGESAAFQSTNKPSYTRKMADLDGAIRAAREAVETTPQDHPDRAAC
jgi:hypothetical protein